MVKYDVFCSLVSTAFTVTSRVRMSTFSTMANNKTNEIYRILFCFHDPETGFRLRKQ